MTTMIINTILYLLVFEYAAWNPVEEKEEQVYLELVCSLIMGYFLFRSCIAYIHHVNDIAYWLPLFLNGLVLFIIVGDIHVEPN